jgi:hypothetical protein
VICARLWFGLAVGAGSLLVAGSALADTALFRVERKFYGAPFPGVTTPGGAGVYERFIDPYYVDFSWGAFLYPPATAIVEPGNPIGGAFTLPTGFSEYVGYDSVTPNTRFPGYTTTSSQHYYNGPGRFGPSNPHAATMTTRIVFPTTMGNPTPNFGSGNPVTATTTFDGRYDFSRAGSIHVIPGPRRFGGTMQLFHGPWAYFRQYIYYFTPALYWAVGSFKCQDPLGVTCTPSVVSSIGDITASVMVTRFLLTESGKTKATTPISLGPGTFPTQYGNASYIATKTYFLHTIHPWTTGFASAHNPLETPTPITPQLQGYDISLGGADITVTHTHTAAMFNSTLSTVTYSQHTYKQYLKGVTRVVSMVRPRLVHRYASNLISPGARTCQVGWRNWSRRTLGRSDIAGCAQAARLFTMKVFFLPEPTGLLLLGVGIAALLGLSRMRRR